MIRALLFDLGNVLIYFDHDRMCRQIGELVGRSGPEVRRELTDSRVFERFDSTQGTSADLYAEVERLFARPLDTDALARALSDIFWRNESIEPVIDQLAARGWPLILVSNTCDAHIRWVDGRFPVLKLFKHRILSFEVGCCKPQAAIFQAAARAAGVGAAECFFTDDTPGHVEAARQLGFDAVVYRNTPELVTALSTRGITIT